MTLCSRWLAHDALVCLVSDGYQRLNYKRVDQFSTTDLSAKKNSACRTRYPRLGRYEEEKKKPHDLTTCLSVSCTLCVSFALPLADIAHPP
jgi:hypothetical protein